MHSLKKYQQFFGLDAPLNSSKTALVDAVAKHFSKSTQFREVDVISAFLHEVKRK